MLLGQLERDRSHQFTLLFGVRHEPRLLYRQELKSLLDTSEFPARSYSDRPEPGWTGCAGHVQEHLSRLSASAGPERVRLRAGGMVDDVRSMLKAAGFDRKADHLREVTTSKCSYQLF